VSEATVERRGGEHASAPPWTTLQLADGPLHLRRAGSGEPLLFLHGSHLAGLWLPFHAALAEAHELVYPLFPGFREGQPPAWLRGFDDLVLALRELLDALELSRVHVVGWALGGWVAANLAVFWPERVSSLVLVSPLGLRVVGQPPFDYLASDPARLPELLFDGNAAAHASLLGDPSEPADYARAYGENGVSARLIWERRYDLKLERRLPRVQVPALVVRPENDRVVPAAHAERWAELLPQARLELVSGTAHGLPAQAPDALAQLISAFTQRGAV
jgi:pimeloyl-ACP methyl ester carboxylesterase